MADRNRSVFSFRVSLEVPGKSFHPSLKITPMKTWRQPVRKYVFRPGAITGIYTTTYLRLVFIHLCEADSSLKARLYKGFGHYKCQSCEGINSKKKIMFALLSYTRSLLPKNPTSAFESDNVGG